MDKSGRDATLEDEAFPMPSRRLTSGDRADPLVLAVDVWSERRAALRFVTRSNSLYRVYLRRDSGLDISSKYLQQHNRFTMSDGLYSQDIVVWGMVSTPSTT